MLYISIHIYVTCYIYNHPGLRSLQMDKSSDQQIDVNNHVAQGAKTLWQYPRPKKPNAIDRHDFVSQRSRCLAITSPL